MKFNDSVTKQLYAQPYEARDYNKMLLQFNGTYLYLVNLSAIQTTAFSEAIKEGAVILSEPKKVIPPETYYSGKRLLD